MSDVNNWLKIVAILQIVSHDVTLAEECRGKTVFLIQKSKGEFRGIILGKVICKAIASLLKFQLMAAISYHDALHGFLAGRGTGTTSIEYKLIQQPTSMREAVLYGFFMDLQKAYDALYQKRALELLAMYRVSPRTLRLLQT